MGKLLTNTIYLYLLQFANYAFSLITLPLITRVLGPEVYGKIGVGMAFSVYFILFIDFGFRLSATKTVSNFRDDKEKLEKIVSNICLAKLFLALICFFAVIIICHFSSALSEIRGLLFLYLLFAFFSSLIPDYLYRGLENMKMITYRAIMMKGIFTMLIFCFLRDADQYYLIPAFQMIGELAALGWIYIDYKKNLKLDLRRPSLKEAYGLLSESAPFFASRIASTVYGVANTTILGLLSPGKSVVGFYTSADRIKSVGSSAMTPIADSFYPYMIRTRDYSKLIRTTLLLEIPILIVCSIIWLYSYELCAMFFGEAFRESGQLLRYMLPVVALTLPNYMFGFPLLVAMGQEKWANYSVEIATVNQIAGIALLFIFSEVTAVNLCIVTLISESLVLLIRLVIMNKHKASLKK